MLDQATDRKLISVPPEQNTFETVMVDVTHRCNMACANCYLPNRGSLDMDIGWLHSFLHALPFRTNIRVAGAEPTLRHDLPEIIQMIRKSGHRAVLLTNGLRLARENYVRVLKDAGLRHVYVSLNGGDNDDWYEAIDHMRCATKKMAAIENVVAQGMILNTGTILTRGVNEGAVQAVYDLVRRLRPRHALLRFKNVGALGRYDKKAERQNLSMSELEGLVAEAMGCTPDDLQSFNRVRGRIEPTTRLFPVDLASPPG